MKKHGIINRKKSKIKKLAKAFENKLSRNEWSMYMHLTSECSSTDLKVKKSLKELHKELKLAVNTIKSCREKLKRYGLIDFYREKDDVTCYDVRDLVQNPILELKADKEPETSSLTEASQPISYADYNYDFVDEEYRACFILYVKHYMENGFKFTQSELQDFYEETLILSAGDQMKEYVTGRILQDKFNAVINRYSLDYIEEDLREEIEQLIWEYDLHQSPLSQREVEGLYMQVFSLCEGKTLKMKHKIIELTRQVQRTKT